MVLCKTSHVLTCFVLGYFGVLVHKWPTNLYALLASTLWFGVDPCLDMEWAFEYLGGQSCSMFNMCVLGTLFSIVTTTFVFWRLEL